METRLGAVLAIVSQTAASVGCAGIGLVFASIVPQALSGPEGDVIGTQLFAVVFSSGLAAAFLIALLGMIKPGRQKFEPASRRTLVALPAS